MCATSNLRGRQAGRQAELAYPAGQGAPLPGPPHAGIARKPTTNQLARQGGHYGAHTPGRPSPLHPNPNPSPPPPPPKPPHTCMPGRTGRLCWPPWHTKPSGLPSHPHPPLQPRPLVVAAPLTCRTGRTGRPCWPPWRRWPPAGSCCAARPARSCRAGWWKRRGAVGAQEAVGDGGGGRRGGPSGRPQQEEEEEPHSTPLEAPASSPAVSPEPHNIHRSPPTHTPLRKYEFSTHPPAGPPSGT